MSDDEYSDDEIYSITSSKAVYKRSRSRASSGTTKESLESETTYMPVKKWAVDYNNRNYVRSFCNKNIGLHRELQGQPRDWHILYDNSNFTRSKVNDHKGLHRKIPEVERKYVPDKDDLADATGWEFDCGPEVDQLEQDVPYIPEGRIITRGCYRWYGVKRNNSDCDVKQIEHRENLLNEELEKELKCGQEFLQSDVPHITIDEEKDRKYSRGAYRHYEVQRNAYDLKPEELESAAHDPEWKRKYHSNGFRTLDLDDRESHMDHSTIKGKPFRRTILNKVYELQNIHDPRESPTRHRTRLSLIPGEGEKTVYEGVPDRLRFKTKEAPSIRSVFKKKSERQTYRSSREGSEFEEYEREDSHSYREELRPEHEEKLRRMVDEKRDIRRRSSYEDEDTDSVRSSERERFKEYAYRVKPEIVEKRNKVNNFDYGGHQMQKRESRRGTKAPDYVERRSSKSSSKDVTYEYVKRRSSKGTSKDVMYNDADFEDYGLVTEKSNKVKDFDYDDRQSQRRERGRGTKDHVYVDRQDNKSSRRNVNYNDADYEEQKSIVEKRSRRNDFDYDHHHLKTGKSSKSRRDYADQLAHSSKSSNRSKSSSMSKSTNRKIKRSDADFEDHGSERDKALKKLPPHVEKRMREIREQMERKMEHVNLKHKKQGDDQLFTNEIEDIDLMEHRRHPNDTGESHNSEYEKYITKNGSEIWIKKEEKYTELHHKDH